MIVGNENLETDRMCKTGVSLSRGEEGRNVEKGLVCWRSREMLVRGQTVLVA